MIIEGAKRLNNVTGNTMCYFSTDHTAILSNGDDDNNELGSRNMLEFGPWIDQVDTTNSMISYHLILIYLK
jgi:hypothetical protein